MYTPPTRNNDLLQSAILFNNLYEQPVRTEIVTDPEVFEGALGSAIKNLGGEISECLDIIPKFEALTDSITHPVMDEDRAKEFIHVLREVADWTIDMTIFLNTEALKAGTIADVEKFASLLHHVGYYVTPEPGRGQLFHQNLVSRTVVRTAFSGEVQLFGHTPADAIARLKSTHKMLEAQVGLLMMAQNKPSAPLESRMSLYRKAYMGMMRLSLEACHSFGIPYLEVLNIVTESNKSKLDDEGRPVYVGEGPTRKVGKGPNYWKPEPAIETFLWSKVQQALSS